MFAGCSQGMKRPNVEYVISLTTFHTLRVIFVDLYSTILRFGNQDVWDDLYGHKTNTIADIVGCDCSNIVRKSEKLRGIAAKRSDRGICVLGFECIELNQYSY